jgi:hypothetical protein
MFLVFYQPIPKKNLVGTFQYCKFGRNLFFTQRGGIGSLFDASQPPFLRNIEVPAKLFKKGVHPKSQLGKKMESVCWSVLVSF